MTDWPSSSSRGRGTRRRNSWPSTQTVSQRPSSSLTLRGMRSARAGDSDWRNRSSGSMRWESPELAQMKVTPRDYVPGGATPHRPEASAGQGEALVAPARDLVALLGVGGEPRQRHE